MTCQRHARPPLWLRILLWKRLVSYLIESPKSYATLTDHSTPQLSSSIQTPRVSRRPAKPCATLKLMARCAVLCLSIMSCKNATKHASLSKAYSFKEFPKMRSLLCRVYLFNTTPNGLRTPWSNLVRSSHSRSLLTQTTPPADMVSSASKIQRQLPLVSLPMKTSRPSV